MKVVFLCDVYIAEECSAFVYMVLCVGALVAVH